MFLSHEADMFIPLSSQESCQESDVLVEDEEEDAQPSTSAQAQGITGTLLSV